MKRIPKHVDFQPGNGTRYDMALVDDPHGGILVIWPSQATYRWFPRYGELRFLHGKLNEYDMRAIQEWLNDMFASLPQTTLEEFQ